MEEKLELNDIADNLLIINQETIERLFQEENKDTLVLYMFYYKTAKWQKHNPIKASDDYTMKCLHWGDHKLKNIKKRLKEMELIEIEKRFNEKKQVIGWYIRVNYFNSSSAISRSAISPLVEEQHHKILLDNNNINTNNNINIIYNWEDFENCECITEKNNICGRRSSYKVNDKNYCNQHFKIYFGEKISTTSNRFKKPTLEEVRDYCLERNNNIDPKTFFDYYEVNNWKDVKNWKQKIITWEMHDKQPKKKTREQEFQEQLERMRKLDEEEGRL